MPQNSEAQNPQHYITSIYNEHYVRRINLAASYCLFINVGTHNDNLLIRVNQNHHLRIYETGKYVEKHFLA